jgi:DNA recombination protein RmuC
LATGRGNLVRRAEVLRQLGIQNSKVLSSSIRENAHIDLQEASPASCNEDA